MKFIKEDIKLILSNCYVQPNSNYVKNSKIGTTITLKDKDGIELDLSGIEFTNSQVGAIRKMYGQYAPSDKEACVEYLLSFINPQKDSLYATTAANALIHIGKLEKVIEKICVNFDDSDEEFYCTVFKSVGEILTYEWNIFSREHVDKFYKWTDECMDGENDIGRSVRNFNTLYQKSIVVIASVWRKLNMLKTKRLKEEIFEQTSQEITTDELALKQEFKRANFPEDLSESLDKIDVKISTANDNFDFKGCMDLIRAFSERMFQHVALSIDPIGGKKINGSDSEEAVKFFVENKLISTETGEVLKTFRHFLSNNGVHRLKSRPDDARLSRNIMIELSLYLLLRLKDMENNLLQ